MLKTKKAESVKLLKEKLAVSGSLVFTNYEGLNVTEVGELKKKLRTINAEYKVVKNNLFRIAVKESGLVDMDTAVYANPLGVVFVPKTGDISSVAKIIYDFRKDKAKLQVKSGYVDQKVCSEKDLEIISKLPSRDVLIAMVLCAMKSPIQKLHGVLSGVISKLPMVLRQIEEKKKAEAK